MIFSEIFMFINVYEPIKYMFIGLGVIGVILIINRWIRGRKL